MAMLLLWCFLLEETMRQIMETIDYIENHLGEKITLQDLSGRVGFSTFHLARVFRALCGCSVMSYVKRRRLVTAAKMLSEYSGTSLNIGIEVGFETQEAFTRAFKNEFYSLYE
jgi:AraC family transcriptional regulator